MPNFSPAIVAAVLTLSCGGMVAVLVWVMRVQIRLAHLETVFDGVPSRLRAIERDLARLLAHFDLEPDDG